MGPRALVFIHSSDELYGADRMLLELVAAVPAGTTVEVWLPTDLAHPSRPLCALLGERGVAVRHVPLPIMRRAYRTPLGLLLLAGKVHTLARELRRTAPDVVYCTTSAAYLAVLSARRANVAIIIGHVQEFWSGSDRVVLAPLAKRMDRLIAISGAVADALPARLRERATVIPNATPDPGPASRRTEPSEPLRFLIASRWNGWKGHRTLFAAWEQAGCPGVLTVLGAAPPSGEFVDVAALAAALSNPRSVVVIGEVSDPNTYIASADVVLVPSDSPEPFGLIAIEAFARAIPVIASSTGGLADIVTDGETGWMFAPRDAAGLADVLMRITRADALAAGRKARLRFEADYTVERYREQWSAVLQDVVSRRSAGSAAT